MIKPTKGNTIICDIRIPLIVFEDTAYRRQAKRSSIKLRIYASIFTYAIGDAIGSIWFNRVVDGLAVITVILWFMTWYYAAACHAKRFKYGPRYRFTNRLFIAN